MSDEFGQSTYGQVQFGCSVGGDAYLYCRCIKGAFLSPFEVQEVHIVRGVKKPVAPVNTLYAKVTNDQTADFNAARYT